MFVIEILEKIMIDIKDEYAQYLGYKCFSDLIDDSSNVELLIHIDNIIKIVKKSKDE